MRSRLLAVFCVLALAAPPALHAQALPHPAFGVMAAANVATVAGSDVSGATNRVSFSIGGFVRIPMSSMWSFQPELEYAGKGAKESSGGTTGTIDLSYLEIPLLFRVASPSTPTGRVFGEVGPAVGFKVDCTISGSSGGVSASESCANAGLDVNTTDFGGVVGAGYEFPLNAMGLSVGVRYNYGFSDVSKGSNAQNRNLQFVAGLRF